VATKTAKNLLHDDSATFDDVDAAGGSDSSSCSVCWVAFGALMNRKHKCRISRRYVCDDCSAKRLVQGTAEYRISDGQFLLARVDAVKEQNAEAVKEQAKSSQKEKANLAAIRQQRLEKEEQSDRDSLFGGMIEKATNYVMGEEADKQPSKKVEGLTASLGQTRDALNQRGEKLASLNDKSAQLVDASADFAKMAKELRKKSEGGLFW
jgi:hypothetical protein